jgi:hypothetical protein
MTLNNLLVIQRRFRSTKDKTAIFWATNHVTIRDGNQSLLDRYVKHLRRLHFLQTLITNELNEHEEYIRAGIKTDQTQKELDAEFEE